MSLLYGDIEYIAESSITALFEKILKGSEFVVSDYERRYPTHCDDLAYVIRQLAEKRLQVIHTNNHKSSNSS
jgi:dTDP-4-dehydrorhamnose reductase